MLTRSAQRRRRPPLIALALVAVAGCGVSATPLAARSPGAAGTPTGPASTTTDGSPPSVTTAALPTTTGAPITTTSVPAWSTTTGPPPTTSPPPPLPAATIPLAEQGGGGGMQVGSLPARPFPVPSGPIITATRADNGTTITVALGSGVQFDLSPAPDGTIFVAAPVNRNHDIDSTILAAAEYPNDLTVAVSRGTTTVDEFVVSGGCGSPPLPHPDCPGEVVRDPFSVTVVVT